MFEFNGQTKIIPGSYGELLVSGNSGANLPDFQVGLIIARSIKGRPYNTPDKPASVLMPLYDNDADLRRDYGDDNIVQLYKEAAKTGAEAVFVLNASPNTKAWFYLKNTTNNVVKLTAKDHWAGICANDITRAITESASTKSHNGTGSMSGTATGSSSTTIVDSGASWTSSALDGRWVRITGGTGAGQIRKISSNNTTTLTVSTWDITPDTTSTYQIVEALWTLTFKIPTNTKRLVEASGTGDSIYVNSYTGLTSGDDVYLTSNGYAAPAVKTIKYIDKVRNTTKGGFRVTFTTAISVSALLTDYARIFQHKDEKEVISWTGDYTLQQVIDEINQNSKYFDAELPSGASLLPAAVAEAYLQNVPAGSASNMTGTASAGASTSLTDSTAAWATNALTGKYIRITGGTGINQIRKISSNTDTIITVPAWTVTVDNTSTYVILDAPGTNPYDTNMTRQECASLAAYTDIASKFKDWGKDFYLNNQVKIRVVLHDSYEDTTKAVFRDLSIVMRENRSPIIVLSGTKYGDTDLSSATSTNPVVRAKALNTDNYVLCVGGLDGYPASLSFAAQAFGLKLKYGAFHNMTRDQLVYTSAEIDWTDTQVKQLLIGGCLIYDKYRKGLQVVRGINTYQYQDKIWNVQDRKTYLQMPRDLADRFFRGIVEGLDDDLVGLEGLTREDVQNYCFKTGNNFQATGEIKSFSILSIKKGEAGWLPSVEIEVADPDDFFGTKVFVIQPSVDL